MFNNRCYCIPRNHTNSYSYSLFLSISEYLFDRIFGEYIVKNKLLVFMGPLAQRYGFLRPPTASRGL